MTMYGLYQPYKVDRPLTSVERKLQLKQGKRKKTEYINCESSVISINSTYLDTVDKFYSKKGIDSIWALSIFLGSMSLIIYVLIRGVLAISSEGYTPLIRMIIGSLFVSLFTAFGAYFVFKEWFRWTHYPIRFNRKNGMVYVFRTNGTVLSVAWKDIFFTQSKDPGPLNEWCIRGHILDESGETVLETFSLGVCENKEYLPEYWEFIRCYMEEDVVPHLADLVVFCPPVENRKEGFIFGFQLLIYMESRIEWLFLPVMLPLSIIGGIVRYIASQTSKIPQWPQDIQDACNVDPLDPVNVSAASNPKDMWRLILANQTHENWQALYKRREAATKKIIECLDALDKDKE